jgi:hypothetical protein
MTALDFMVKTPKTFDKKKLINLIEILIKNGAEVRSSTLCESQHSNRGVLGLLLDHVDYNILNERKDNIIHKIVITRINYDIIQKIFQKGASIYTRINCKYIYKYFQTLPYGVCSESKELVKKISDMNNIYIAFKKYKLSNNDLIRYAICVLND